MYNCETLYKFNKDKSTKHFPGSTIIQKFGAGEFRDLIASVKNEYFVHSFAEKLVFLPVDSYHMTITGLLVYQDLSMNNWSEEIPTGLKSDSEWDNYIINLLEDIYSNLKVSMVVTGFNENKILLEPKTLKDRELIDSYRKRVLEKIGIEFDPDYQFHITLNYTLIDLTNDDLQKLNSLVTKLNKKYKPLFEDIVIDSPTLALFNDMSTFFDYSAGRNN